MTIAQTELNPATLAKWNQVLAILRGTGGCAVAYSGGVDSSLLLAGAHAELGDRCLGVIGDSPTYARREFESALAWVCLRKIPHIVIATRELSDETFRDNPPERCYHCKRELFQRVREAAQQHGLPAAAEGSNADDVNDFRPGRRAARELGILSPLETAGLTKPEIRELARVLYQLPMADKPSTPCLASRFPYGTVVNAEKLHSVETVETFLLNHGCRIVRARHHGEWLRLELGAEEETLLLSNPPLRQECIRLAQQLGFKHVTLDLQGFRSGSANENLRLGLAQ